MLQLLLLPCHGAQLLCRWAGSPEQHNWGNPLNRAQAWAELPVLEEPNDSLQAGPQPKASGCMGYSSWHRQTAGGHELRTRVNRNRPVPRRKHGHVSSKASGCVIHGGKLSTQLHPQGLSLGRAVLGTQGGTQDQQSACDRGCPGRA